MRPIHRLVTLFTLFTIVITLPSLRLATNKAISVVDDPDVVYKSEIGMSDVKSTRYARNSNISTSSHLQKRDDNKESLTNHHEIETNISDITTNHVGSFTDLIGCEATNNTNNITNPRNKIRHAITFGKPRTATTVQFNLVCVSLFLHTLNFQPTLANHTICSYSGRGGGSWGNLLQIDTLPQVVKSHRIPQKKAVHKSTWLFTTGKDVLDATTTQELFQSSFGRDQKVGYVQDLATLSKIGIEGMVQKYATIFSLPSCQVEAMQEYFDIWDKLRVCCGMQMSKYWRNELLPIHSRHKKSNMANHTFCNTLDIDEVERKFMETQLYKLMNGYERMKWINRPALVDGPLNGTYCSRYNQDVREMELGFNQARDMRYYDETTFYNISKELGDSYL